jgi:hypothetical protein
LKTLCTFFFVRIPRELLCYEPIMSLTLVFVLLVAALRVSTHHLTRPCAPGIAFRLTPDHGSVVPMPSTTYHCLNAHVNRWCCFYLPEGGANSPRWSCLRLCTISSFHEKDYCHRIWRKVVSMRVHRSLFELSYALIWICYGFLSQ